MIYPYFQPGSIVRVAVWPFNHIGIATERFVAGQQTIISASRRRGVVAEETMLEFSRGREVKLVGHPGKLDAQTVLARARSRLGTLWNAFNANCEHFASWAHDVEVESPQLQIVTALIALGVGIAAVRAA